MPYIWYLAGTMCLLLVTFCAQGLKGQCSCCQGWFWTLMTVREQWLVNVAHVWSTFVAGIYNHNILEFEDLDPLQSLWLRTIMGQDEQSLINSERCERIWSNQKSPLHLSIVECNASCFQSTAVQIWSLIWTLVEESSGTQPWNLGFNTLTPGLKAQ